jgi:hypothetical protein
MRFGVRVFGSFAFMLLLTGVASARAQGSSWGELSVTAGRVDYDLSGTGHASGIAIRATRDLTPHVGLELRGLFARPCQQFQSCKDVGPATLFVPEAQLQYRWNAGRLQPFVGAGLGLSALRSSFYKATDWDPTVSFSAGTGVRLTDRVALTGEFRLRGHEFRFVGTSTEVNAGLSWRLPGF